MWTVPTGLRGLLDDITHAVMDVNIATTTRSESTQQQICRLIADVLDTWLDERTHLELKQRDSLYDPHNSSTGVHNNEKEQSASATSAH